MPPLARPAISPQPAPLPNSGTRSVISYLLFIHFFFLLIGIKSSTGSPSGLDQDLANKIPGLRPYLQLLAMDLSYMVHLTYYDPRDPNEYSEEGQFQPEDTDFIVEVDVPQADGSMQTVQWPPKPYMPGLIGRTRWQQLVSQVAIDSEYDGDVSSFLSAGIAKRIMAETQCGQNSKRQPMVVRFRRRLLQDLVPRQEVSWDDLAAEYAKDPLDPSYLQTSFELIAFLTDDDQFRSTTKKADFNTAAPADAPPRRGPRPTATPTSTGSAGTGANP